MKTYTNLFDNITSFENLLLASRKARKCKRAQSNVATFELNLENELVELQHELESMEYRPGGYRTFCVFEPKKRMISAAPYRDRVVHHALCNVIEPLFERKFIYDTYANRTNKGTHKAILRCQSFARKRKYVLQCDISKFFPSIDHEILKGEIRTTIACPRTLWLIDAIIDGSNPQDKTMEYFPDDDLFTPTMRRKGLPIGNLTSQNFGNIYLNSFDHFVKEELRCSFYLRYVDDFLVFGDDKNELHSIKKRIEQYFDRLRLTLHRNKCVVFPVTNGIPWLGQRVFPEFRLLKKDNVTRFKRRLAKMRQAFAAGLARPKDLRSSINGWLGHAMWADTYCLRTRLFSQYRFSREWA